MASSGNHVMISYAFPDQEKVFGIRDRLKKHNYKVWIDEGEDGDGTSLEAMANAVEKAAVILLCFSERYAESSNCRRECSYATSCDKPLIPLMMECFVPKGWLGFIIGDKYYFDFSDTSSCLDDKFRLLLKTLGNRGKN